MNTGEKAMAGLIGFCVLLWFFGQPAPKPQLAITTNSTELMAQVATVKDSLTVQDHFPDATKMVPPAPSPSDRVKSNPTELCQCDVGGAPCECTNCNCGLQSLSDSKPHEKIKREVLVFVSANCPPCDRWKRCEMQRFMDAGWSVGIVEKHSYGLTPTFEITSGGTTITRSGYTTLEQAAEAVR
jgi:hypothetical protein